MSKSPPPLSPGMKITRAFLEDYTVVFYPSNQRETETILSNLYAMGIEWTRGYGRTMADVGVCLRYGIVVLKPQSVGGREIKRPTIYTVSVPDQCDFRATLDDFAPLTPAEKMTDRELLMAVFNQLADLSARIEKIEHDLADVAGYYEERKIDKSRTASRQSSL